MVERVRVDVLGVGMRGCAERKPVDGERGTGSICGACGFNGANSDCGTASFRGTH